MLKHTALTVKKENAAAAAVGGFLYEQTQTVEHPAKRTAGSDQLEEALFARQKRFGAWPLSNVRALQDNPDCTVGTRDTVLHGS